MPESKAKNAENKQSRIAAYEAQEAEGLTAPMLDMPELEECAVYLVDWLHMAGTVGSGMHGAVPLTWAELQAWAQLSDSQPTPWESSQLMAMSRAYAAMSSKATDPNCPAPHVPDADTLDRAALGNKIKQGFRAFGKKK